MAKRPPSILLIEPDRLLARGYVEALVQAGYDPQWSNDAQTAILAADKKTPKLVIVELQLAGHSGVEFLYEFRSYPEWQKVPVLVLSGVPREESGMPGELDLAGFLYKPQISLRKLVTTVGRILEPAHAR